MTEREASHKAPPTGPDPIFLKEIEDQAITWAMACGNHAASRFRTGLSVSYKGANRRDPVTEADHFIEDYLREEIAIRFPGHRVLGEERSDLGPTAAEFVWVVDPVDGTVNFAGGLPLFAVSIAVLHEGVPVVGAMYVSQGIALEPAVVHARRGAGCYSGVTRLAAFDEPAVHPSHPAALPASFWRRFSFGASLSRMPIEVRSLGSIAFELAYVASGAFQFGMYRAPRIWDVAAGVIMVTEAGGGVYVWHRTRATWVPFERFASPLRKDGTSGKLRDWRMPLLAGGRLVTAHVAQPLRPRGELSARLLKLVLRFIG